MRFKLIIIVFLSYCMPSQAQYVANQIDSLLINRIFNVDYTKSFQTISVEEGLPLHSDVRSIVQDSIGYIWLATANGLARYNGYSVVLYKLTENGEELPKQRTLDLVITPDQNILLATVSGLFRYNRMLDKIEKLDIPELKGMQVRSIHSYKDTLAVLAFNEKEGNIYTMGVNNLKIIHTYKVTNKEFTIVTNIFQDYVRFDSRGRIWFAGRFIFTGYIENNQVIKFKDENNHDIGSFGFAQISEDEIWFHGEPMRFFSYKTKKLTKSKANTHNYATANTSIGLFIGGWSEFLVHYHKNKLTVYKHNSILGHSFLGGYIHCIFEDKNHNIWIGTEKGLAKLSNTENLSTLVRHESLDNLQAFRSITPKGNIVQSSDESIWSGSHTSGLIKLNPKSMKLKTYRYNPEEKDLTKQIICPGNNITGVEKDTADNIWFSLWGVDKNIEYQAVQKLDPITETYTSFQKQSKGTYERWANGVIMDSENQMRMAGWGNGIGFPMIKDNHLVYDNSIIGFYSNIFDVSIYQNQLWVSYGSYLLRIQNKKETFYVIDRNIHVNRISEFKPALSVNMGYWRFLKQKSKPVIAISDSGYIFNTNNEKFSKICKKPESTCYDADRQMIYVLENNNVFGYHIVSKSTQKHTLPENIRPLYLEHDSADWLWVGNHDSIFRYQLSSANHKQVHKFKNSGQVNLIKKTQDSILWIFTDSLIYTFTNEVWKQSANKYGHVNDITMNTKTKEYWLATDNGIFCTNSGKQYIPGFEHRKESDKITSIVCTNSVYILGTLSGMLYFNPQNSRFTEFPVASNFIQDAHLDWAIKDKKGNIWVQANLKYLTQIFPSKDYKTRQFVKLRDFPDVEIYDMNTDVFGITRMATDKGVYRLDTLSYKFIPDTAFSFLKNENIQALLETSNGLWLSTKSYLVFAGWNQKLEIVSGLLPSGEVFVIKSFQELADGRLIKGFGTGFLIFHPDSVLKNSAEKIHLLFDRFRTNDRDYFIYGNKVTLDHTSKYAELLIGNLNPEQMDTSLIKIYVNEIEIHPRLTSEGWLYKFDVESGEEYNLVIQHSEVPIRNLQIEINNTPIYKTAHFGWFILVVIGILAFIIYMQKRRNEIAEQRKQIVLRNLEINQSYMSPHFIGNVIEHLNFTNNSNIEERTEMLRTLGLIMNKLTKTHQILYWTLGEEWDLIEKYLQIQHKLYGNKIIIDRDEPEDFPDNNYVLKTFLLSMVENAFRHGLVLNGEQIWQISISYKLKPNTFYVEIQDNGKGFDTQLKRTRGALSKFDDTIENLKKYNQNKPCITYEYLSSPGMGTTVKIEILLDYNYESPSTQKSLYASVISMVKGN